MKKLITLFIFSCTCFMAAQGQKNISRLGSFYANGQTLAGCWHYADSAGHEYALIGAANGIMILDISNPASPIYLFQLPGLNSLWHEIKVSGDYAYAVSEAQDPDTLMDGMQVIDLRYLPDSAPNYFWHSDGIMTDKLRQAHSITVDNNYIYVNGHSVPNHGHGVLILDKSDPWNPVYVGAESNRYCHDSYVRGDTLWTSDIQDGMFSVYDISNRANPVLLATQQTPASFNHNSWLSDDSHYLYTADERSGSPIGSYDVSDLSNITLVDEYYTINMLPAEAHNVRVLNDFIINASYGSQVTIIDAARPDNLVEVGNYPTGAFLCWDADPYLPSGIIIATDTQTDSAYFLQPTYIRACYLEGNVSDSVTGLNLPDSKVDIVSVGLHDSTNLSGNYKTGYADAGLYSVEFSKPGYRSKTIPAQLNNGVLTVLNVQLVDSNYNGIGEVNRADLVRIENNPSGDKMVIVLSEALRSKFQGLHLTIADESGKTILDKENIVNPRVVLNRKDVSAGVYFYRLMSGREILGSGKLVFN